MAILGWIGTDVALSQAALTVRAQSLPPNDRDEQLWDTFLPRQDVDSIWLKEVTSLDFRPTADRREWNARGRAIPMLRPNMRDITIVPIEARNTIDEYEMQRMTERANGNEAVLRDLIGVTLEQRTDRLVQSVFRRVEADAMAAWANGAIVQKNPENGQTFTVSFGFSASRYTTAGTAWNDAGVNAYTLLQAWITAAEDLVGPIEGAMTTLNVINAILADAPTLPNSVVMTRSQLEDRISQDKGGPFRLYANERKVDIFTDGGLAYTRTRLWPAGKIAAIPEGQTIGATAFAPVVRAGDLAAQVPGAGIDRNGVAIYYEPANGGKELMIEAQQNSFPVPDEQLLYVTATGIA